MGPTNQLECIELIELLDDIAAEEPASPPRTHLPGQQVIRVTPHHVRKRPLVWDFLVALDQPDLVDRLYFGREAPVHAENRVFD